MSMQDETNYISFLSVSPFLNFVLKSHYRGKKIAEGLIHLFEKKKPLPYLGC